MWDIIDQSGWPFLQSTYEHEGADATPGDRARHSSKVSLPRAVKSNPFSHLLGRAARSLRPSILSTKFLRVKSIQYYVTT